MICALSSFTFIITFIIIFYIIYILYFKIDTVVTNVLKDQDLSHTNTHTAPVACVKSHKLSSDFDLTWLPSPTEGQEGDGSRHKLERSNHCFGGKSKKMM